MAAPETQEVPVLYSTSERKRSLRIGALLWAIAPFLYFFLLVIGGTEYSVLCFLLPHVPLLIAFPQGWKRLSILGSALAVFALVPLSGGEESLRRVFLIAFWGISVGIIAPIRSSSERENPDSYRSLTNALIFLTILLWAEVFLAAAAQGPLLAEANKYISVARLINILVFGLGYLGYSLAGLLGLDSRELEEEERQEL